MVKGINKQILLTAMYETVFGIYNHLQPNKDKPLASVALHEIEDVNTNDALRSSLLNYVRLDIGELWKISYLEYISLPSFIVKELNETSGKAKKEKAELLNSAINSINQKD